MSPKISADDLIVWPCGTWCHRYELEEFSHKSDDYRIISIFSAESDDFYRSLNRPKPRAPSSRAPFCTPPADQCPGDGLDAPAEAQQGACLTSSAADDGLTALDLQVLDILENDFDAFFDYLTTPHPAPSVQANADLYPGARLV